MEAAMYQLLSERLPASAVISIAHRPTVAKYHAKRLSLAPDGEAMRLVAT
jgi:vitamin B12/bleomycin/antimicrobial peptide transport system ATP-binding/permease protein